MAGGGVLVAVLLPVVAAIWHRPQRGVLLLLALLPFDGLLLVADLPAAASAWKEALLVVTLLAAANPRWRPATPAPVPAWAWPAALLATVSLITFAWAPPVQALVGMKITFFGMLTAAVVWRCPLTRRDRDHVVTILAITGTIVALAGIAQQFLGPDRLAAMGYEYNATIRFAGGVMRSWSTFNQPFPFAFFLMVVTLVTGSVALGGRDRLRNRLVLLAMPLFLAGMAVALVRAAWIGLLAGAVYLAVTRHRVLLTAAPVLVGAISIGMILGAAGFFTPPSIDARLSRWQQVPAVVAAAPFGQGVGSAGAAAAKTETLAGGTPTYDPARLGATSVVFQPDNNYLKVLYEVGVLGLGLFILALTAAFAGTRRTETDPELGAFASGVSSVLVAAAVASLASSLFEIFPLDYIVWLLVGVATTGAAHYAAPITTAVATPAVASARSGQ